MRKINNIDLFIIANFILLVISLIYFDRSDLDFKIQNIFFDFEQKMWFVNAQDPIKKIIFYQLPKVLFGLIATAYLVLVIFGFKILPKSQIWRYRLNSKWSNKIIQNRHKFLLILFGLVLIPLIAGNIKKFTNIYCPSQLEVYGGRYPYAGIFRNYPENLALEKKGKCFPAGHSITGFALIIFFFAASNKKQKIISFFAAFFIGWILGFYQIAKGAHFLSDTIVSMFVCFLLGGLIARIYAANSKNHLAPI